MVFDISLATGGNDYEPYFSALQQTLGNHMRIDRMDGENRWSRFISHGIVLDVPMNNITNSLWNNYPKLTLAQTLRMAPPRQPQRLPSP